MPLEETDYLTFILLDEVSVYVIGSILYLAGALSLRDQLLKLFLWQLEKLLVERNLLRDDSQAELFTDCNLVSL